MRITSLSQLSPTEQYSYADYLLWQFSERVELIKGYIMQMAAPNRKHQRVSGNLQFLMASYFRKTKCNLYNAPFDVRLYNKEKSIQTDKDIYTVVQPDLCVICDDLKLDERGCLGAPDWIVEILSPGNSKKEIRYKHALYEEHGVKEYWIVFPSEHTLIQFVLNEQSKYQIYGTFAEDDLVPAYLFPDLIIDLKEVFEE